MNSNVRKLTDGAMMAAIVGALLVLDRQFAFLFSGSFLFIFPLPMVFYAAKYGFKDSLSVLAADFVLLFLLGTPQTIFFVGAECIIGLIYGCGIHSGTDNRRILFRTLILSALVELFAMFVLSSILGYDLAAELSAYEGMVNDIMGVTGTELPATIDMSQYFMTIFILSVILTGMMEGALTHVLGRMLLKRLRIRIPESKPIREYFPPKWAGYLAFAAAAAYYYSVYRPFGDTVMQASVQAIGMAGLIYLVAFGVIGMAVELPVLFPKAKSFVPLIVIVLLLFMSVGTAVFGFLYITTDYHERILKGEFRYGSED